jgi:prevent-host-death family protein
MLMNTMQLREAKARLSALVDAAQKGEPTTITRHGKPAAVVVSLEAARKMYPEEEPNLIDYLMSMPEEIPIRRNRSRSRRVKL